MSDSDFSVVSRYIGFLDVIDEDWAKDTLSDDDIEVPEGLEALSADGDVEEGADAPEEDEIKWTDYQLERE
ncbi:unnamed protein product [Chrysoparadoxa australica]